MHASRTRVSAACAGLALAAMLFAPDPVRAQFAPFPPPGLATVSVGGFESFVVRVHDPIVLGEMWEIAQGLSPPRIVYGTILPGNRGYNRDVGNAWSWHLDEGTIGLADFTIEICDGLPSFVEADLAYGAGMFCPWLSQVVDVRPDDSIAADTNVDGAVDPLDANRIAACLTPPGGVCWQSTIACCQGDVDVDTDVDCDDWALVEAAWTDAVAPVPPATCQAAPSVPLVSMPGLGLWLLLSGGIAGRWVAARRRTQV